MLPTNPDPVKVAYTCALAFSNTEGGQITPYHTLHCHWQHQLHWLAGARRKVAQLVATHGGNRAVG